MQDEEEKQRITHMQHDIDHVVCAWIYPKELAVGHMRESRYGMPVCCDWVQPGPLKTVPGQARFNLGVFGYELRVIVENIVVVSDRPIN